MKAKTKGFWVGSIFLLLTGILQYLARRQPGFADFYARSVYPVLVSVVGRFFGIFPFSVVELGLYLLILFIIWYGISHIRQPLRVLPVLYFIICVLAFTYTTNCGINYYGESFAAYIDLPVQASSKEELKELCLLLLDGINAQEEQSIPGDGELKAQAVRDMRSLGGEYAVLGGSYPKPKGVAVSYILSVQSVSGIYSPFTIEANFNRDMPGYNKPHTLCHELSHLKGFMREEEANFIGYLACVQSSSPYSKYSGYLTGFVYATNALFKQDREFVLELYDRLPEHAVRDLKENNLFWERYQGKISEVSTKINDTYLKANSQQDGVQSYGRVVDLMLAYYR